MIARIFPLFWRYNLSVLIWFLTIYSTINEEPNLPKPSRILETGFNIAYLLLDKNLLDKMTGRIDKIIIEKEDSVRIYCLCANCEKEIRVMGKGRRD